MSIDLKFIQSKDEVVEQSSKTIKFTGRHGSSDGEGKQTTFPKQSTESATSKVSTNYSSAPSK